MSAATQPLRAHADGAPQASSLILAAAVPARRGTPKLGMTCLVCDDWGTLVAEDHHGHPVAEIPCPDHTPRQEDAT